MSLFNWIYKLLRWGLGGIFIYAGSIKLFEPKTFAVLIESYGIVPENLLMSVAMGLLVLEVAVGIGLLFDIEGSLSVAAGLLGLFIAILGYGIWMGLDVDCGCFGPDDPEAEVDFGQLFLPTQLTGAEFERAEVTLGVEQSKPPCSRNRL